MRAAGYLCNIDGLGRIVIPKQLRNQFELDKGACLEIFTEENRIIMKKYRSCCIFCSEESDLKEYMGKFVCTKCLKAMTE